MKEASPPVSAMATPTNGSGNLVDELEEAFQHCLNVLTKDEAVPNNDKDEMKVEVEQTVLRFIDLARQMEAFFLQKRFLLSALKPEMIIKEDISELRAESTRKEELLRRHYDKIAIWQNLLADLQGYAKSPAAAQQQQQGSATTTPTLPNGTNVTPSPMGSGTSTPTVGPPTGGIVAGTSGAIPVNQTNAMMVPNMTAMQQQLQQQQLQQLQQQQQQQQQQQIQQMHQQQMQQLQQQMQVASGMTPGGGGGGGGVGPGMVSPQQAMFMQQQAAMAAGGNTSGAGGPRGGPFSQPGPGGVLQGPLAYLEKTTSNIDNNYLDGMSDGRR